MAQVERRRSCLAFLRYIMMTSNVYTEVSRVLFTVYNKNIPLRPSSFQEVVGSLGMYTTCQRTGHSKHNTPRSNVSTLGKSGSNRILTRSYARPSHLITNMPGFVRVR